MEPLLDYRWQEWSGEQHLSYIPGVFLFRRWYSCTTSNEAHLSKIRVFNTCGFLMYRTALYISNYMSELGCLIAAITHKLSIFPCMRFHTGGGFGQLQGSTLIVVIGHNFPDIHVYWLMCWGNPATEYSHAGNLCQVFLGLPNAQPLWNHMWIPTHQLKSTLVRMPSLVQFSELVEDTFLN